MTAFANHSEWESWSARWCVKCARDEMGTAPTGTFCRLIGMAILDNTVPPQWTPDPKHGYLCSEFVTGTTPAYPEQWHPVFAHSQDGTVIHRVGCALAFGGRPWHWSTDATMDSCRRLATLAGWSPCKFCEPFK